MAAAATKASMSTTPSPTAIRRLSRDLQKMKEEPVDGIEAAPLEENILEWHYVIRGSKGTAFEGGFYHGKLVFPADFPWKPPSIYMFTPNGRFVPNQRLCLSISDYHPESWNPGWTVSAILVGLHSFMNESSIATGTETTTEERKKELAVKSAPYNLRDSTFCALFPTIVQEIQGKGVKPMDDDQLNEAKTASCSRYNRAGAYVQPLNAADFRQHMQMMHADLEAVMRAAMQVRGGPGAAPAAAAAGAPRLVENAAVAAHQAAEAAARAAAAAAGAVAAPARGADDAWVLDPVGVDPVVGDFFHEFADAGGVAQMMPNPVAPDDAAANGDLQQLQQQPAAAGTPPRRPGDAHSDAPAAKRTPPVVTLD